MSGLGRPAAVKTSMIFPSAPGDHTGNELAHGGVELVRTLAVAADGFDQRGFDRLEERDVVADRGGGIARRAEGKGPGEFSDDLHEALLAVRLFEDVFLRRREERVGFLRVAHHGFPGEAVQDVAGDLVLFLQNRDGLRGIDCGIPLPAALGVDGEGVFQLIG